MHPTNARYRFGGSAPDLSDLDRGLVVGLLIGEGHFGGDGKYPHITLRMHVRHETLFRWLHTRFPRSRLYGPYEHSGRRYFQWMARGPALAEDVLPIVEAVLTEDWTDWRCSGCGTAGSVEFNSGLYFFSHF